MTDRPCPACQGPAPQRGHLLCKPCWFAVPKPLQRKVHAAWKAVTDTSRSDGKLAAMQAYRAAADAAAHAARQARFPETSSERKTR